MSPERLRKDTGEWDPITSGRLRDAVPWWDWPVTWAAGPNERRQRRLGHSLRHPSSSLGEPQVLTTKASLWNPSQKKEISFSLPKGKHAGKGENVPPCTLHPSLLPVLVMDGAVFPHAFPPALNRGLTAPVPSSSSLSKATFPRLAFSSLLFSAPHHLLLTVQPSLLGTCHFQKTEHLGTQGVPKHLGT